MSRSLGLLFAAVCYAIFFATFLYLIAFVGDFSFAGLTVNRGPQTSPAIAAVIDLALIALFGLQHSIMARQPFKRRWTRIVPWALERSVFVLAASIALMIMFLGWRPITAVVWNVTSAAGADILWALFWIGWLTVLVSTFLINHFELFGLQQAWFNFRGLDMQPPKFREPMFYRWVRHPIYAGFFLAFWSIPTMTAGHLLLAGGMSAWMLVAIRYEERDLVAFHGHEYEAYRTRVGMLIPRFRRRSV